MIRRCFLSIFFGLTALAVDAPVEAAKQLEPHTVERFAEYAQWSLSADAAAGNPFDVLATVIFTHPASGETRVTEMFFDGGDTWRFRFSGSRTGTWNFRTRSEHPDLNGWTGKVRVTANTRSSDNGFVGACGNQWLWQGSGRVFVPQLVMLGGQSGGGPALYDEREEVDALVEQFIRWHGFTGFHVGLLGGFWFDKDGDLTVSPQQRDPDPRTFAALELLISRVYSAGAMVHLWAWGDEARHQTPIGLPGGINGAVDRRLQRYIAARLGALPGWTLGYGFDLYEWVEQDELHTWHAFMQRRLGWPHLLGGRPQAPWSGTDHSAQRSWNRGLSYSSYEHHRPSYEVYLAAIRDGLDQPVFSEDRFRVDGQGRPKDYTEAETRRGLWHSTMAGGVANIWGQLAADEQVNATGIYRNRQQLKTYSTFFFDRHRFRPGMHAVAGITDGLALATPDNANYVFYRENSDSIRIDLSQASGSTTAIAVDARNGYSEVALDTLEAAEQTVKLGHVSDWAIAVGSIAPRGGGDGREPCVPSLVDARSEGAPVAIDLFGNCRSAADGFGLHGFDPISEHGGRIRLSGDRMLVYSPPFWFGGTDSFGYTVREGDGIYSARVTIAVRPDDSATAVLVALALGGLLVIGLYTARLERGT